MKRVILSTSIVSMAILFAVIGCNKNDSSTPTTTDASLQATVTLNAEDQVSLQNDDDNIESDVTQAARVANNFNGTAPAASYDVSTISGAVIDLSTLTATKKLIKIGYTIANVTKKGAVTIELVKGSKWTDIGAQLKETLDSVKVTNPITHKSRTYQTTRYITNLLGGSPFAISALNPFYYTIHSYGTVTYEDNSVASYWIARKNSIFYTPATFTSTGDTTINGDTCSMGGKTRSQNDFLVKAPQLYAASIVCGFAKPYSGVRNYVSANSNFIITLGVNTSGVQVGSTATCDSLYGYQIQWTKLSGATGVATIAY